MYKFAKIVSACLFGMIFLSRCTDHDKSSPYAEILSRAPFAALSDSIKNDPGNEELWFRRAVLLNSNNFPEPALADFRKAWNLRKDERFALGISTLQMESSPDSAILFLNQALQEIPNSFLLQLSLARAYDKKNETDAALLTCEKILGQNPQQTDVLKLKADLLDKKGRASEATAVFEKVLRITPFDVELNYILALRYAEAKDPKALALCDSLIKADTENTHAEPYYYKGIYYANTGDRNKALEMFDEAVRHDYYFLEGYIEKGSILFEMKKYNEALAVFQLALTISPKFADSYYWIAKCQEATGRKEEARVNYLRAFELDKSFKEAKDAADRLVN